MQVEKIVSGGQTGVDRAALDTALAYDIPIGGWCPRGRRAEDGTIPERYPLRETPTDAYAQRTAWNVRDSDGTLVITDGEVEGGTAYTVEEAERRGQPLLHIQLSESALILRIREWVDEHEVRILNVAGPRASEVDGIYEGARKVLTKFVEALN